MFSKPSPHDVNVVTPRATTHFNGHKPHFRGNMRQCAPSVPHAPVQRTGSPCEVFTETGWRERLTQKVPYGLKTVMGVLFLLGSVLLGYMFGGDDPDRDVRG